MASNVEAGPPLKVSSSDAPQASAALNTPLEPLESVQNLSQLLKRAAETDGSLCFYSETIAGPDSSTISYRELLTEARIKARLVSDFIQAQSPEQVLLIHFDSQRDSIVWFWAATLAGFLPCMSPPLVNDIGQRKKHLLHLHGLLREPTILTTTKLAADFLELSQLKLRAVEDLLSNGVNGSVGQLVDYDAGQKAGAESTAALMLTSGSTDNVKAVPLRHRQVLDAVNGKSAYHGTSSRDIFLSWVGLDHVASLVEVHLHAMSLGANEIHVPASSLVQDPMLFIRLLDGHNVTYTFAPNFFLAMVLNTLKSNAGCTANLSSLRALVSGGEANPTATCQDLTRELRRLGCRGEVIRPGFGMTETCAGSIYSQYCPSYDIERSVEFASVGSCIPGMKMRVRSLHDSHDEAPRGQTGELHVTGKVVISQYYNDKKATREAFTSDGWFRTGDLAWIDDAGNLHLAGRIKDSIIVNGVKWSAAELENTLDDERIPGVAPSFTMCFPTRAPGSSTEGIAVAYSPRFRDEDLGSRSETVRAITRVISLITGRRPARIVPLPPSMLEKSSLGKISRSKIRAALESGQLGPVEREDQRLLDNDRQRKWRSARTASEKIVQGILAELLKKPVMEIGVETSIFDHGVDSMHLILLKSRLQGAIGTQIDIPMSVLLTAPTVVAIASAIDQLVSHPIVYAPVVPLQPHGSATPLFFIHPGSGDILVFIALAAHFPTRPVYALRSRGYNPGESFFSSIEATAELYAAEICKTQPEGPYAIAGYSLGSTLAFEVGKVLEKQGREVRFLASIDYPPHIAPYVRGLDWVDVLLHIAFFLELIDEDTLKKITPHLHTLDRDEALSYVLEIGDAERASALAINVDRLELISDIAENFRVNVQTYEPVGKVESLDVFVADPPSYAARDRQDWQENKLGLWAGFARTGVEFHDCPGIHAKMLNREHVADFAKIFKAAMRMRGV
ncbi:hypothetical protein CORC01_09867 [Colletotrichum orchidophilum]|uniref:Carrier domain-containing protein n=1 Tax=Colletotrichum orchidophilum TaxID=1209926 RepID=A0A1G4B0A3_9PEZI|nr:uncharacterized protein CORC01_09867 [Colletotrichum orchidophilum]OHE94849.1 hypothetical protein CORC01_09867 [Colletotrichum orchidophilum]